MEGTEILDRMLDECKDNQEPGVFFVTEDIHEKLGFIDYYKGIPVIMPMKIFKDQAVLFNKTWYENYKNNTKEFIEILKEWKT